MRSNQLWALVIALALVTSIAHAAPQYTLTEVGSLFPNGSMYPYGINDLGQVTGVAYTKANRMISSGPTRAFLYGDGSLEDLGTAIPGNYGNSLGFAINNRGEVAGVSTTDYGVGVGAFLHSGSANISIGSLGGDGSEADAINNKGEVVGWSYMGGNDQFRRAFLYRDGQIQQIGPDAGEVYAFSINDLGQVLGGWSGGTWLYKDGQWQTLDRYPAAYPGGVGGALLNNKGVIAGSARLNRYVNGQFALLQDGQWTLIGALPGHDTSSPIAMNDLGQVVGYSSNSLDLTTQVPFLYTDGQMIDATTLLPPGTEFLNIRELRGINNVGQIVGWGQVRYYDAATYNWITADRAFILTPVPEPSSALIALVGCCSSSLRRKRRQHGRHE